MLSLKEKIILETKTAEEFQNLMDNLFNTSYDILKLIQKSDTFSKEINMKVIEEKRKELQPQIHKLILKDLFITSLYENFKEEDIQTCVKNSKIHDLFVEFAQEEISKCKIILKLISR